MGMDVAMLDSIVNYINENYGSKRGLLNAMKFGAYAHVGAYARLTNIQWQRVERLIFVCSGNICRSPLASARASALDIASESFGLHCGDDYPADPRAISFARRRDIDMTHHRTRHIRLYVPHPADLIVGMEPAHEKDLRIYRDKGGAQLTLAGFWLKNPKPYIHDPFSASPAFFDKCELEVLTSVDNLLAKARG